MNSYKMGRFFKWFKTLAVRALSDIRHLAVRCRLVFYLRKYFCSCFKQSHVKTHKLLQDCKQVVTNLFTSCRQVVFALLVWRFCICVTIIIAKISHHPIVKAVFHSTATSRNIFFCVQVISSTVALRKQRNAPRFGTIEVTASRGIRNGPVLLLKA
jgi:hypothetical protein